MNETITVDRIEDDQSRYIAKGIISNREPQFAIFDGRPLTADEMDRQGFSDAANAKRARLFAGDMGWNALYEQERRADRIRR